MRETINKILILQEELEQAATGAATAERTLVTGLELPDIIRDVVDLLFPELKPYEAAFYMYMLRHSIVHTGSQLMRVSTRGLQMGVVKSAYAGSAKGGKEADSTTSALKTIRTVVAGLESVGAIRREGEPNREGTLYRVLLPEEIEVCRLAREARTAALPAPAVDEAREVDYYNIRENRVKVYERDNYHCRYCNKQLTRFTATLDHVHPVAEGGDNSLNNLVTACLDCNSRKNARPLGDFLADRVTTTPVLDGARTNKRSGALLHDRRHLREPLGKIIVELIAIPAVIWPLRNSVEMRRRDQAPTTLPGPHRSACPFRQKPSQWRRDRPPARWRQLDA